MPITPAGSGSARQRGWQPAELQGQRAVGGDDRTPGSPATATCKRPYGLRHLVAATTCLTTAPQARHDPHQVPRLPPATCARCTRPRSRSRSCRAISPRTARPAPTTPSAGGPRPTRLNWASVPFYGSWLNRIEPQFIASATSPSTAPTTMAPRAGGHDPPRRRLAEPARHRPPRPQDRRTRRGHKEGKGCFGVVGSAAVQ